MKAQDFEKNSKEIIDHCWGLLFSKAKEYASDEDRLANFKQPTSLFGVSAPEICLYYDSKHIASMVMIAQDISKGKLPTRELLKEKVGDYLNYGMLFYSTVLELIEKEEQEDLAKMEENAPKMDTVELILENCETFLFQKKDIEVSSHWNNITNEYESVTIDIKKDAIEWGAQRFDARSWQERLSVPDITSVYLTWFDDKGDKHIDRIQVPWKDADDGGFGEINAWEKVSQNDKYFTIDITKPENV